MPLDDGGPALRIGCAGLPVRMSRERYFRDLSLLEADLLREPVKLATIRRWREEAPASAEFTLQAPPTLAGSAFADTEANRAELERTLEAARALAATALVFRTPPTFAPSLANRSAMQRFFGGLPREGAALIWEPEGLWDGGAAARLASELDLVLVRDPLAGGLAGSEAADLGSSGPLAYFRIRGLGSARQRCSDDQLTEIMDLCAETTRAWVVFDTPERFRDAKRCTALAARDATA